MVGAKHSCGYNRNMPDVSVCDYAPQGLSIVQHGRSGYGAGVVVVGRCRYSKRSHHSNLA